MADIQNEIESIKAFVAPVVPGVRFFLQNMPDEYVANSLSIDFEQSKGASETGASFRIDRVVQLVYFGPTAADCLRKMGAIDQKFSNAQVIQLRDSSRYLRIGSFSLSKPFKTETTGVFATIGVLNVSLRELRPQPIYGKVQEINTSVN